MVDLIDEKTISKEFYTLRSRTDIGSGGIFVDISIPTEYLTVHKSSILDTLDYIFKDIKAKVISGVV